MRQMVMLSVLLCSLFLVGCDTDSSTGSQHLPSDKLWRRALKYETKGKVESAIATWKKAISKSLDDTPLFTIGSMGMSTTPLMRQPDAVANVLHSRSVILKSSSIPKERFKAYISRAVAFASYRRLALAKADLDAAITLDSSSIDAHFYRGLVRCRG